MITNKLTEKEEEMLKLIDETLCAKYLGKLKVCYDETIESYILYLYLNREMTPIMFSKQGSWEVFCDYVRDELKSRRLQEVASWACKRAPDNI